MARNDTGKWVARAAATGGSRAYRGQRPVKWYSSLVLICILGVALVWYSRYEHQHPSSGGQPPAVGASWYAALSVDICGTVEPGLPATPTVKGQSPGITSLGKGVIHIAPKTASEAGANATVGRLAAEYPGMTLTSTTIQYPGKTSAGATVGRTFTLGEKCPKGTKYAGKAGIVQAVSWATPTTKSGVPAGDPPSLRFADQQEITLAFLPKGISVPRPPGTIVAAMLQTVSAANAGSAAGGSGATSSGATSSGSASTASSGATGSSATSSGGAGSSSAGTSSATSAGAGKAGSSG